MLIPIIICGVVLLTLIIMYFVYNNKEVALRKEADAQRGKIESVYDTMWKVLKQEAGVTDQYRKTFEVRKEKTLWNGILTVSLKT